MSSTPRPEPSVAFGPYRGFVPFLNIERVKIAPNGARLNIKLSNEIVAPGPLTSQTKISFGNYVLVSANKALIERLNVDDSEIRDRILRAQPPVIREFTLQPSKDFRPKTQMGQSHQILQHTYDKEQDISSIDPFGDLYVLVVSYLKDPGKGTITIGSVLKETILIAGRPPGYNNIYKLQGAENQHGNFADLWPSAVHLQGQPSPDGKNTPAPMPGRFHVLTPHPMLSEDELINAKTTDLRVLTAVQQSTPQVDPALGPVAQNNQTNINLPIGGPAPEDLLSPTTTYFSNVHLSRDDDGVVFGYFAFDLRDYFKANSLFGRYMDNEAALAACMEVLDIRIFRTKTNKLDVRSNALTAGTPHSSLCKIKSSGSEYPFIDVASLNNGVDIIKKFNDGEILGIAFRDDEAKTYVTGGLEYFVEISLADKTKEAFLDLYKQIESRISGWNANADKASSVVTTYMAIVQFLRGVSGFGEFTPLEWQRTLLTMVSKQYSYDSQDPELLINSLIRAFALALEGILNANNTSNNSGVANFHSAIAQTNSPLALVASTQLNGGIEITNPSGVGLNYIEDYLSSTGAVIPSITYATFQQRIEAERAKFPEANLNAEPTNPMGYLTPASVNLGTLGSVNTTTQQIDLGGQEALFAANPPTTIQAVNVNYTAPANANAAVLSSLGVSVAPLRVSLNRVVAAAALVTPETTLASEVLNVTSHFNQEMSTEETQGSGSNQSIINVGPENQGAFGAYAGPLANKILGEEMGSFNIPGPPATNPAGGSMATVTPAFEQWETLTSVAFDTARLNSEMLICRLSEVHDPTYSPTGSNTVYTPLSTIFVIGPLRALKIEPTWRLLLRSYMRPRDEYANAYASMQSTFGKRALYSQKIPYDLSILLAAAEQAPEPPLLIVTMDPNQTIPMAPIATPPQASEVPSAPRVMTTQPANSTPPPRAMRPVVLDQSALQNNSAGPAPMQTQVSQASTQASTAPTQMSQASTQTSMNMNLGPYTSNRRGGN
mgnify:CR=1 FL=1